MFYRLLFTSLRCVIQLRNIKGIGKSLLDKIQEILETGSLLKLENFQEDKKTRAMVELCSIWGVGPSTAEELMKKGYYSVQDLRTRGVTENEHGLDDLLTHQQQIGLKHFEAIQERIPRQRVSKLARGMQSLLS